MPFVLLDSSDGQSPMPPLSERNVSLQLVLLSQLTEDGFWREGIWVQGRPQATTKNHLLEAGPAVGISKALPTYLHIKPKGWKKKTNFLAAAIGIIPSPCHKAPQTPHEATEDIEDRSSHVRGQC